MESLTAVTGGLFNSKNEVLFVLSVELVVSSAILILESSQSSDAGRATINLRGYVEVLYYK